jgi:hypothetical protein
MKAVLLFSFVLITSYLPAQNNCIKGRIIGVRQIFTMGVGYERMLSSKTSLQLLFNRFGYDFRDTDGGAAFTHSLIPEYRFYFGKKRKETLNKAAYLGLFTEIAKTNKYGGGEQFGDDIYVGGYRKMVNPGLLIGRNLEISKKWFAEMYIGFKYQLIKEAETRRLNVQTEVTELHFTHRAGIRLGMNIGYRF